MGKRAQGDKAVLTGGESAESPLPRVLSIAPSFRIPWPPAGGSSGPTMGAEVSGQRQGQWRRRAMR